MGKFVDFFSKCLSSKLTAETTENLGSHHTFI